MMIRADKFFIKALQEAGYNIDFKKLTEIYRKLRQHPEHLKRKQKNQKEREDFARFLSEKENIIQKLFD